MSEADRLYLSISGETVILRIRKDGITSAFTVNRRELRAALASAGDKSVVGEATMGIGFTRLQSELAALHRTAESHDEPDWEDERNGC